MELESGIPGEMSLFDRERLLESCGDDISLVQEIMEMALELVPQALDRISSAITTGELRDAADEAHGLKGTFLTLESKSLAESCQDLMTFAKREWLSEVERHARILSEQWELLRLELERHCATLGRPGVKTI